MIRILIGTKDPIALKGFPHLARALNEGLYKVMQENTARTKELTDFEDLSLSKASSNRFHVNYPGVTLKNQGSY